MFGCKHNSNIVVGNKHVPWSYSTKDEQANDHTLRENESVVSRANAEQL
jgi:hypothetical protein